MRFTIVLTLAAFFVFSSGQVVLANEDQIGQSRIHPASPFYFLKSVREILELKFAGTTNVKSLRYLEFSTRRIREVKSLMSVNRPDLIPPTLEKYSSSLEKVLGLINFRDEVLGPQVIDKVGKHVLILEGLFNQTENQKAKIAIRLAIYRISRWNEQLLGRLVSEDKVRLSPEITKNQAFICNFLSKEASSSALNDTEKAVLTQRAQKCLQIKSL
ncbi:MAG: Uncharacterized protein G01um10147_268 [Microgenomates group bacterium Gr01-1014_7]|nr:MAG: Uncharacterized protein G01um10147_268 [Microgenomates group bacterium Gr01-1014_7]